MHNSIIFGSVRLRDWKFDKTYILFTLFYKYLYRINIRKNDFYIVQQNWFKESIGRTFRIDLDKVVVARPVNRPQRIFPPRRRYTGLAGHFSSRR